MKEELKGIVYIQNEIEELEKVIKKEKEKRKAFKNSRRELQNEIYSTRRLEALDLAIRLNPAQADLISLAEQIYQFLTKDLTGNKI